MPDASVQTLKIATWNVMRPTTFSSRNVNILGILESIDADILILTETNSCIDLSKKYQTVQIIDWERLAGLGNLGIAGAFNTSLQGKYYVSEFGRRKINDCFE